MRHTCSDCPFRKFFSQLDIYAAVYILSFRSVQIRTVYYRSSMEYHISIAEISIFLVIVTQ